MADLQALLTRLESEEREVSSLRRKLQERIDNFPNEVAIQQERELSARRRGLHEQIDHLRIRIRSLQGTDPS